MKKYNKGPLSLSSLLPSVLKPITKNFSSNLLKIKENWFKIVGEDFYDETSPSKIYKKNNQNILEILVYTNNALELSYDSYIIQKNINNLFQSDYINIVRFKKKINE